MSEGARAAHVLTLVEERSEELIGRIVARAEEFYAGDVPADEMAANASAMAQAAIGALRDNRTASEDELAVAAMLGERRARQGVPLEGVLRALRIGAREALVSVRDAAAASGLQVRETIDLTARLWDWIDDASTTVASAHRSVELARARSDEQQRAALVHGLVRGTLDPRAAAERAAPFGLDPERDHVVVCARPTDAVGAAELERLLVPRTWTVGATADVDGDVVAILPEPPAELPVAAGLGPAVPFGGLARSYREAARAAATAAAFGRTGLHRLGDLAFPAVVLADEPLATLLTERYVAPVAALGAFGEELLHSLRVFIAHDQNVDAAARELHVHANTLRHRLGRYEETVGVSLRRVEQLAEVWWALTAQQVDGAGSPAKRAAR